MWRRSRDWTKPTVPNATWKVEFRTAKLCAAAPADDAARSLQQVARWGPQ
jgi:hypothetical protein